ncbi:hypothetical protein DTO207G8_5474 [Paecilomyces variotii]|nr:hypothetical protein DTO207G8_5474 [Paecilomyces variotii]KAJ9261522.1 hypothetical protein DTO195F2_4052 [Paecilomyces variotii]
MFSTQAAPSQNDDTERRPWTIGPDDGYREAADSERQHPEEDTENKQNGDVEDSTPTAPLPAIGKRDVLIRDEISMVDDPSLSGTPAAPTEIPSDEEISRPDTICTESIPEAYGKTAGINSHDQQRARSEKSSSNESYTSTSAASPKMGKKDTSRDMIENPAVERFVAALWDETKSTQYIFRLYREIPSPGVAYLSKRSRGFLLRRFADPPDRRWIDARRYLALIEDMNAAGLPVSRALWTSAIHFAGRASGRVFKRDLRRAIGIWHQMERVAGIESDNVVFSTLFDIAIKAGQYTVADRLMEEMKTRGIPFRRSLKVSKIYYHGFLRDVEGIRQAFDDFIKSGEIVDTVVLNCLIVSFLRAGEPGTAEQLYDRMMEAQKKLEKELQAGNQRLPHHPTLASDMPTYRKRMKELRRTLNLSTSLRDELPEEHRLLQASLSMAPDTRTFHIFLSYHASQTGNLFAFMSVLKDMERTFDVPPRAMVYLFLFEGFARFGRKRRQWSAERLQDVWKSYLRLLYETRMSVIDRTTLRRDKLLWENPLSNSMEEEMREKLLKNTPNELYAPLPFREMNSKKQSKEDALDEEDHYGTDETEEDADEDEAEEMLKNPRQAGVEKELGELEKRIENGVFLGRRVILAILRAFGACSGPYAVMNVWLRLERIWQPKKRKALDVMAIKDELERQLSKGSWR